MSTKLPLAEFRGPAVPGLDDPERDAFWFLSACVPEFHKRDEKKAPQQDRIHSLRTLLADVVPMTTDDLECRAPRAKKVHLIVGDDDRFEEDKERFFVRLPKKTDDFESDEGKGFRTVHEKTPNRAVFQQVIVEPLYDARRLPVLDDRISVPRYRLVAGAIEILVKKDAMRWLGPLLGGRKEVLLRLTPNGIELDAKLPFPTPNDPPLDGRFLLFPMRNGTRIRLLSDRLKQPELGKWQEAWRRITPDSDEAEEALVGLKIEARRDGLPPAFEWLAETDGDDEIKRISKSIDIPGADLRVRLLSPKGRNGVDGEVTLEPELYTLAKFDLATVKKVSDSWTETAALMLTTSIRSADDDATRFLLDSRPADESAGLVAGRSGRVAHRCAHDEVVLARALRAAHGFEEPLPGTPDPKRPLLSAFVPLDDGWLQLPIPNVPPPDLTRDENLTVPTPIPNVLSGYLRFAQAGALPSVLSAFPAVGSNAPEPFKVTEAPWVVTIEGAQSVDFALGFNSGSESSTLIRGAASLGGPELSTRGLVWISADQPDVLESLPRIGAGAGTYIDIPIETFDIERNPALQFTLHQLGFRVERGDPFDAVARKNLAVSASFDVEADAWEKITGVATKALDEARKIVTGESEAARIRKIPPPVPPVIWQRHETTPLAAEMPMTRGALSAVRPLESRDLVPFVVDMPAESPMPFVLLSWLADAAFPTVTREDGKPLSRRSVAAWPWPERELSQAEGIALAAFGVPGAEVAFGEDDKASDDPWSTLRFALRYDIPALDEAFATASLPPQPPETARPEERETPPPLPVPLAHDWPTMKLFWGEQNRSHQLARVHHSYLASYRAIGNGNPKKTPVQDLVGDLFWKTDVGFRAGAGGMPYGEAVIGDPADPLFADRALLGVSGHFTFDGELKKLPAATSETLEVTGYAPESFLDDADSVPDAEKFLFDSRRAGSRPAKRFADRLLWRELRILDPEPVDADPKLVDFALATLLAPIAVGEAFTFWFKDLPVPVADGKFARELQSIDFRAWQDSHLPLAGFEWRLVPTQKLGEPMEIFERGRDRIPFFGFLLEPLRLSACELELVDGKPTGQVLAATIVARLHLGPAGASSSDDANLVTIGLTKGGQDLLRIMSFEGPALRFAFDGREGAEISPRRVAVAGSVKWDGSKPSFTVKEFTVSMFGSDQKFEGATLAPAAAVEKPVVISWSRAGVMVGPGRGKFVVDSIRVETKVTKEGESDDFAVLSIGRRLLITPRGNDPLAAPRPAIEMSLTAGNAVSSLRIVHLTVEGSAARFTENHGALALTVSADLATGEILSGFPVEGHLSLGLIARLAPAENGSMEITAGWLDGELVASKDPDASARVDLRRVAFHAEQSRRPERLDGTVQVDWVGALRLFGRLSLDSAIGWPGVENGADVDHQPITKGTHVITPNPASFHVHHVEYVLDGHALPFDVAACIQDRRADAVWAVPVASKHTLTDKANAKDVSFTSVETIAIGAAVAIVPALGKPNAQKPELGFSNDPVTWAARQVKVVENGEVTNKTAQGMVKAGVGRLATVLSGALGLPFRAAFGEHTGLFLAGGFAGLVGAVDGEESPLLRLPVLATFDKNDPLAKAGFISGKTPATPVNVAWVDGRAEREVIATLGSAVTPTSSSESALRSALLAGSRTRSSSGLTPEQTAMAILVEQHFDDHADDLTKGDLEKMPFFVAAMVGVARTLAELAKVSKPVVLSLLAGHGLRDFTRGLAAAVVTRDLPLANAEEQELRLQPQLATLGNDVVVHGWPGPPVAELEGVVPVALAAGPAFADHVQPRVVLLRTVHGGKSQYDAPPLPRGHERPRMIRPEADRAFADGGRGYGLELGASPLRWLAGPEEGRTRPYRDEGVEGDLKKPQVSGLAGLSRVMAMPFHASAGKANDDLVWVAQTRAPIYLALPIDGLESPPIPWLTPGTPRSRHVTKQTLDETFAGVSSGDVQAILPTAATIASVGDRAGISLARIARFETAAPAREPFDGLHPRFGRAAQGGSWSVRTERTPRPGPLPPNRGDEERDRRPCASPLLPGLPLMALEGPADRVGGEAVEGLIPRWTVTFVAAQEWDGMVTESWDGTIRLLAEIDLASVDEQNPPKNTAAKTLLRLLFPPADADPNTLQTRAALVIGEVVVPFRRMHVGKAKEFAIVGNIRRVVVPLVLDARVSDASEQRSAALAAIGQAFTGPTLPSVEVRMVVHPDSTRKDATVPGAIALTTDAAPALAIGKARAPVTLRLPLAPVIRTRGALPLAPTSLLFVDPAYDAGLSSAPAEDRARISAKGNEARGALSVVLYADRARVNRRASVTFMMDVAYEKKLDTREARIVDSAAIDGDIVEGTAKNEFDLRVAVVPKNGERRVLFIAPPSPVAVPGFTPPPQPTVPLARVCELPFSSLVEKDGTAARLEPGDVFELQVEESAARRISVKVLGTTTNAADGIALAALHTTTITRALRIVLTDEPVVEPPAALYAALVRRAQGKVRLSLPLYAQSPLPWRVDLRDAKRDFRRGLLRRAATFIWTLGRPRRERPDTGIHIVKADRNGQTHLPAETEFEKSRPL